MSELRNQLVRIVAERGVISFDEPVRLASGDLSRHFVDTNRALARGGDLRVACLALIELAAEMGVEYDAVGGLTMGADKLAHGVSVVAGTEWFSVRKAPKQRGTNRRVEGADVNGRRVLLVEDVVTRGGSIADALAAIRQEGGSVVAAASVVDRGHFGTRLFEAEQLAYRALVTYEDLGIPPVGDDREAPAATGA